jgi:hypothetical protein
MNQFPPAGPPSIQFGPLGIFTKILTDIRNFVLLVSTTPAGVVSTSEKLLPVMKPCLRFSSIP